MGNQLPAVIQTASSKNLQKVIFSLDKPEEVVPKIPPQLLYFSIKQTGLHESLELLEICTPQQCQLLLDFDLWQKDRFSEERFWQWLELPDVLEDTNILKKILRSADLKLIGDLIIRYVSVINFEEPTDAPPGDNYHTPDLGKTWVAVKIQDEHRHFLLTRLLAAIFDYSVEVFYQIIQIRNLATSTQLQEDSFSEREKRLVAEGFPEYDYAWEINSPKKFKLKQKTGLKEKTLKVKVSEDINYLPVSAVLEETLQPFSSLWTTTQSAETIAELDAELTLICNSALVRWGVDLGELEKIEQMNQCVCGAINIGLEEILQRSDLKIEDLYQEIQILQKLYRHGLFQLFGLKHKAEKIPEEKLRQLYQTNNQLFYTIAGLNIDFPLQAKRLTDSSAKQQEYEYLPLKSLEQVETIRQSLPAT